MNLTWQKVIWFWLLLSPLLGTAAFAIYKDKKRPKKHQCFKQRIRLKQD